MKLKFSNSFFTVWSSFIEVKTVEAVILHQMYQHILYIFGLIALEKHFPRSFWSNALESQLPTPLVSWEPKLASFLYQTLLSLNSWTSIKIEKFHFFLETWKNQDSIVIGYAVFAHNVWTVWRCLNVNLTLVKTFTFTLFSKQSLPSVVRGLKSKGAQLALCHELSLRARQNRSLLEHDQFDLVVRLMNSALQVCSSDCCYEQKLQMGSCYLNFTSTYPGTSIQCRCNSAEPR